MGGCVMDKTNKAEKKEGNGCNFRQEEMSLDERSKEVSYTDI